MNRREFLAVPAVAAGAWAGKPLSVTPMQDLTVREAVIEALGTRG
jgi:hypothetical protein